MHCCGQQSASCSRLSVNLFKVISKLEIAWYCLDTTKKPQIIPYSEWFGAFVTYCHCFWSMDGDRYLLHKGMGKKVGEKLAEYKVTPMCVLTAHTFDGLPHRASELFAYLLQNVFGVTLQLSGELEP